MNPLKNQFNNLEVRPRPTLARDIILFIEERKKIVGRRRFWTFSALGVLSLGLAIPAFIYMINQVSQSGLFQYASLAASGALATSRADVMNAVVGSLPVTGIILVLGALGLFAWSVRRAFILPARAIA